MPRHRIEREPRHRAQRPVREHPRRVQLSAVSTRPAGHRKPGAGPRVSVPWQAIGSGAAGRLTTLGTWLRPYRRKFLTGAVRGLLVSPWFAAGAGFVVAAGAFMYAPHGQLSFGNGLIHQTPCKAAKCHQQTEQGAPLAAGGGAGLVTSSPAAVTPPPTAGLTFRYAVNWHSHGTFQMVLTVIGKSAIGSWQLGFVIPGATDISVLGADWQQSGTDGGTATGITYGADAPARAQSTPGIDRPSPGDDSDGGSRQSGAVFLIVNGNGTPAAPADCTFDGSACHFSLS